MSNILFVNATPGRPGRSNYSNRVSKDTWTKHERYVRNLHAQGCTREQIRELLRRERGFHPSSGQLTLQFSRWRLFSVHRRPEASRVQRPSPTLDDSPRTNSVQDNVQPTLSHIGVGMEDTLPLNAGKSIPWTNHHKSADANVFLTANDKLILEGIHCLSADENPWLLMTRDSNLTDTSMLLLKSLPPMAPSLHSSSCSTYRHFKRSGYNEWQYAVDSIKSSFGFASTATAYPSITSEPRDDILNGAGYAGDTSSSPESDDTSHG
ncbi:hypothetical protein H2198_000345 [Neophaeococcomyces mojaviensis]|uniref:Uncharacterized protein n=1 Tax=Neophaeococcomyces mojaviensis TaxID=3383035 RepID=A0ACC3AL26_9EURO|nr:hypothetical protein H2198_000345 [Knufia sp. JES_112]